VGRSENKPQLLSFLYNYSVSLTLWGGSTLSYLRRPPPFDSAYLCLSCLRFCLFVPKHRFCLPRCMLILQARCRCLSFLCQNIDSACCPLRSKIDKGVVGPGRQAGPRLPKRSSPQIVVCSLLCRHKHPWHHDRAPSPSELLLPPGRPISCY